MSVVSALPPFDESVGMAAHLGELIPGSVASVVFGSHARGSGVTALSDVDILVLVGDRSKTRGVRELAASISPGEISVLVHDEGSLSELRRLDWSFVEHLRREHVPAYGDVDRLAYMFRTPTPCLGAIREEIASHEMATSHLVEPHVLGGRHLVAYGHLFAAAKSAAILDGLVHDDVTFDRHEALARVAHRDPDLQEAVDLVSRLEPFWLRLRRRQHVSLPWTPRHDHQRFSVYAAAVQALLRRLARPR